MKKFYINLALLLAFLMILLCLLDYLSTLDHWRIVLARYTDSFEYIDGFPGTGEIKPYIDQVRSQDSTTKLIIGDSVCHQMFSGLQECNKDVSIAATNGAITMAGQYILVKEYLDNHTNVTDIFLMILPQSIERTYDTKWGYQYAVMPFVETDTIGDLDDDTIEMIRSVYGSFFLRPAVVEAVDRSGINRKMYLNIIKKYSSGHVLDNKFEIADRYVTKIDELCKENGVAFHLLPCPVTEEKKDYVAGLADEFALSKMRSINSEFMNEIYYYPAERSSDGSHFAGEYANQVCYNEIIRLMYEKEGLLDSLVLQ